jgi:uncharacterized membrane protein HdeD (DUF308 family)
MVTEINRVELHTIEIDKNVWRWFVGMGCALALLGLLASANLVMATVAAAYIVALAMFAAGIVMVVHASAVRGLGWALVWAAFGILYAAAATFLFYDQQLAVRLITVWLAVLLTASGAVRMVASLVHPLPGWGWMLVSGIFSVAAGLIIASGWPANAMWVLGLVMAIDLLVHGMMLILVGVRLRPATSH